MAKFVDLFLLKMRPFSHSCWCLARFGRGICISLSCPGHRVEHAALKKESHIELLAGLRTNILVLQESPQTQVFYSSQTIYDPTSELLHTVTSGERFHANTS